MSELSVLYPFDDNYAAYGGISLTSLLENNKSFDRIRVFILGFDLSEQSITGLKRTVNRYKRELTFIDPLEIDSYIRKFNLPSYRGARIAVARLFVTKYISSDIKRLLYLDSDTIIVKDLSELISSDLGLNTVGMVCDSVGRDYKRMRGFLPDEEYYNGGVILYDLDLWRKRKCTERIEEHVLKVRKQYEALDQDLINIVLKGEIAKLDLRFNLQPFHIAYSPKLYSQVYGLKGYYTNEEIENASKNPVILHAFRYLGMFPWNAGSIHPCVDEYEYYKRISEWKEIKPIVAINEDVAIKIERILHRGLPKRLFLIVFRVAFQLKMRMIELKTIIGMDYINI